MVSRRWLQCRRGGRVSDYSAVSLSSLRREENSAAWHAKECGAMPQITPFGRPHSCRTLNWAVTCKRNEGREQEQQAGTICRRLILATSFIGCCITAHFNDCLSFVRSARISQRRATRGHGLLVVMFSFATQERRRGTLPNCKWPPLI